MVQHSRVALAQCTLSRKREEFSWKRGGKRFWNRVMMKWFLLAPSSSSWVKWFPFPPGSSAPSCFVGIAIWCEIRIRVGLEGGFWEHMYNNLVRWVVDISFACPVWMEKSFFLAFFVLLLSAIYYFVTNWDRIGITFGFLCDLHLGSKFKNLMFKQLKKGLLVYNLQDKYDQFKLFKCQLYIENLTRTTLKSKFIWTRFSKTR